MFANFTRSTKLSWLLFVDLSSFLTSMVLFLLCQCLGKNPLRRRFALSLRAAFNICNQQKIHKTHYKYLKFGHQLSYLFLCLFYGVHFIVL